MAVSRKQIQSNNAPQDQAVLARLRPNVGYAVIEAGAKVLRSLTRQVREHNLLSLVQFHALTHIGDEPGITQIQLADKLEVDASRAVIIVDSLEAAGLAARRPSHTDRRVRELRLTDAGRRTVEDVVRISLDFERTLTASMGEKERKELLRLLTRLNSDPA